MTVREMCERLELKPLTGECGMDREVSGAYICDLLSWVMSHAQRGDAWITIQTHTNIVAVATLLELSSVIIAEAAEVEEDTIKKAIDEDIPILVSNKSAFLIAKGLLNAGLGK
ncbi:AraC family transcriptional regulator [Lutispora saccharofermentans]|uniref:AraC family transcriptional regulator n=1 Tax=Lutispora saccharofermentans TaxID=3024236 RepID=A0ABT1NB44_9FIRM|nr:AraC family transcriptional regulator [Lutispora saccharofermentans]MCQ1528490.1 AraC family transcriptional regulator [Lutispora saccharofermentans]